MTVVQVPVPLHPPPLQPMKIEPAAAAAVSVTELFVGNEALQVFPQLMPLGLLVTVPVPVPALFTVSVEGTALKVAVTDLFALITTTHVPVPLHPLPLQPPKVDPVAAVAVKVTVVPDTKGKLQVAPHTIPAGLLVTVPIPAPAGVTVRVNVFTGAVKVAVTVWSAFITTIQDPVPLQPPPLQPVNVEPPVGAAVRATVLPLGKSAAQIVPQEIPLGLLVTVPVPVPDVVTVNWFVLAMVLNVADTLALPVTVQGPLPEQAPPQLTNDEPAAAAAFKATEVPASNWCEQVAPQLMPAGVEVTVPLPVPCLVTVMIVGGAGAGPLFTSAGVGPLSLQPVSPRTQMVQSTTAQRRMFPIKFPPLIEIVSCYIR
jgi:hypothetical protein